MRDSRVTLGSLGVLRRDPFRHLPPPPAGAELRAGLPAGRETAATRLASFVTPDAAAYGREAAWTIPAVAAGLQVIAGTIGALPLHRLERGSWVEVTDESGFLEQLDPEEPTSATLTRVVEDLVLHPYAYLVVIGRYASGFPMWARYVPSEAVTPPTTAGGPYRIAVDGSTYTVAAHDVIRFVAPTPGLLTTGARAITTALSLENAARRLADADLPAGALKNTGPDMPGDQVDALLALWETARRTRTTGYLNAQLDFVPFAWDAEQLALVPGREYQVAEFARLLNLPTRYLNAPTTSSLTYSTTEGQRRELTDLSLRPYLSAVEDRLSMADVTPRTQLVRFDLDDFLRGDATERTAVASARIAAGMTSPAEERAAERIPGPPPAPTPAPAPAAPVQELAP